MARGFTLTEMAIVLAVVAVIIGAIWVAIANVIENLKVNTAAKEAAYIVTSYRNFYDQRGIEMPGSNDVTCDGAGQIKGFFPPSMGGDGCVPNTFATYPQNPWGGHVTVVTQQSDQSISIRYDGLSNDACIRYVTQIPNASDIIQVNIQGMFMDATFIPPISPEVAIGQCVPMNLPGATLAVAVWYKAR